MRFVVVLPLIPLAIGDRFLTRDWPLHITIVPVFTADATLEHVADALYGQRLTVTGGGEERFGRGNSVRVTVIEPTPNILSLHRGLLQNLAPLHPVFDEPDFTGDGFRPHVTRRAFGGVERGAVLELDQLAVVDMTPGQPDRMRRVLAVIPLSRP